MNCSAKKSFGSVPPFEGLTQVVVGEKYPPGAYFGRRDSTMRYTRGTDSRLWRGTFPYARGPVVVDYYATICEVTGCVWFRAGRPPSDPCVWTDEITPVKPGDRVLPGRLISGEVECERRVFVCLEDELGGIEVVHLSSLDFHTIEAPTIVHCEEFTRVRWCPPESVW